MLKIFPAPQRPFFKKETARFFLQGVAAEQRAGQFFRPLRTLSDEVVNATVVQAEDSALNVQLDRAIAAQDEEVIRRQVTSHSLPQRLLGQEVFMLSSSLPQVARMLRLSPADEEAVGSFQAMHAKAKQENFGRLLRSPTAWEDVVKCILLCNCG